MYRMLVETKKGREIGGKEGREGGRGRGNQERGRKLKKKDQKRRKMREDNSSPDKGLLWLGI